ncbi:MAG: DUF3524 domain-containing protein [Actinomycetota bacterium]
MQPEPLDVVLVEPWLGGSHEAWARGYAAASRHRVRVVGHQGGPWRWRLQASSVTLAAELAATCRWEPMDLLLVSSMTDLAQLLGIARRTVGDTPVVHFRHESQLLYPEAIGARISKGIRLQEWASLVAADRVVFNSEYHRTALLEALPRLLDDAPDHRHHGRLPALAAASSVLPVGVDLSELRARPAIDRAVPTVLFNHRWHHDKQPEAALDALLAVADRGVAFELVMCGADDLPDDRPVRHRLARLGDRVRHAGELDRAAYVEVLHDADVVLSTATQECFGVAVVEAIAAGCVPVLPDRLSYPELIPTRYHGDVLYGPETLVDRLAVVLNDVGAARRRVDGLAEDTHRFDWSTVAPTYDRFLADVVAGARR